MRKVTNRLGSTMNTLQWDSSTFVERQISVLDAGQLDDRGKMMEERIGDTCIKRRCL